MNDFTHIQGLQRRQQQTPLLQKTGRTKSWTQNQAKKMWLRQTARKRRNRKVVLIPLRMTQRKPVPVF